MLAPRRLAPTADRRRAATTVEVAFTIPILFLVLFSAVEAARLNMLRNTLENAVYEGARRGIIPGATAEAVEENVSRVLASIDVKDAEITIDPPFIDADSATVAVTVDVPLSTNGWLTSGTSRHMQRTCTLSRERTD